VDVRDIIISRQATIPFGLDTDEFLVDCFIEEMDNVTPITAAPSNEERVALELARKKVGKESFEAKFDSALVFVSRMDSSDDCSGYAVCHKFHVTRPLYTPRGRGSKHHCAICKAWV